MKVDRRNEKNPNAVLTPALVVELRRMHKLGFGYGWLAKHMGITKSCVQKVVKGRTWKRVPQAHAVRSRVHSRRRRRRSP